MSGVRQGGFSPTIFGAKVRNILVGREWSLSHSRGPPHCACGSQLADQPDRWGRACPFLSLPGGYYGGDGSWAFAPCHLSKKSFQCPRQTRGTFGSVADNSACFCLFSRTVVLTTIFALWSLMKGSEPIKILSYNLHLGRSAFRKRAIEEGLVQTILREQCDIVMIQELWLPEDAVIHSFFNTASSGSQSSWIITISHCSRRMVCTRPSSIALLRKALQPRCLSQKSDRRGSRANHPARAVRYRDDPGGGIQCAAVLEASARLISAVSAVRCLIRWPSEEKRGSSLSSGRPIASASACPHRLVAARDVEGPVGGRVNPVRRRERMMIAGGTRRTACIEVDSRRPR